MGITTLDATMLAFNTLQSQMATILAVMSNPVLESLGDLLEKQKQFICDTYSQEVDDFNQAADLIDSLQTDNTTKKSEIEILRLELSRHKRDAEKILDLSRQVAVQRDTYKKDADLLRSVKPERDRLKKQVDRLKESNEKLESKSARLEQGQKKLKRDVLNSAMSIAKMKQACNAVMQVMMYDGCAPEIIKQIDGVTYYFYRKPLNKTDLTIEDFEVSRAHQYFFTVQTSIGTHRDILPGENGTLAINRARPLPNEITSLALSEFEKETLFIPMENPIFATDKLRKLFSEIDECVKEMA